MICDGGLYLCTVCGGAEGSLPTDCPGERMPDCIQSEVQAGEIDFQWREGWIVLDKTNRRRR